MLEVLQGWVLRQVHLCAAVRCECCSCDDMHSHQLLGKRTALLELQSGSACSLERKQELSESQDAHSEVLALLCASQARCTAEAGMGTAP